MSAIGELFINEELTEMASKVDLLNLSKERLVIPEGYFEIWRDEDLPSIDEIAIEIYHNEDDPKNDYDYREGTKVGKINFKLEHFVDDWGYGKFINHYIVSLERNGIIKHFDKDYYNVVI